MKITICLFLCFFLTLSCTNKNNTKNEIPVASIEKTMGSNIEIINEKQISSDTENISNIFDVNDFIDTGKGYIYDKSTNKKRIIFDKIFDGLYISLYYDYEISEHMEEFNNYMAFIGYNCKNELINAFNESENTKWRRIFDDEWYANIKVMGADITITSDGQITSRFFIYTYDEDDRYAGRFFVDINENKIIYPHPEYGRD